MKKFYNYKIDIKFKKKTNYKYLNLNKKDNIY